MKISLQYDHCRNLIQFNGYVSSEYHDNGPKRFRSNLSLRYESLRSRSSRLINTSSDDDHSYQTETERGKEIFMQYLDTLEKIESLQNEKEIIKSQQMYEAWKRADENEKGHDNNNQRRRNSGGMAVVKTIVKHTNQNNDKRKVQKQNIRIDHHDSNSTINMNNDDPISKLQQQAKDLLSISALQYQYPQALLILGNQLLEQLSMIPINEMRTDIQRYDKLLEQVMEYYRIAGQNGLSEGWYNLGHILWTGIPAVIDDNDTSETNNHDHDHEATTILLQPDKVRAMESFEKACLLNDPDALYFVGVQLLNQEEEQHQQHQQDEDDDDDNDIKTKMQKGLQYIEQSALLGHNQALYYLALFYVNGNEILNIVPCPDDEFQTRLNMACVAYSSDALFLRGNCYYHGYHQFHVNYEKAMEDFLAASELDHADAAISAGAILYHGTSRVAANKRRAFELYQHAGELGSTDGWKNVIACYMVGDGIPQSMEMANHIAKTMLGISLDEFINKSNEIK